MVKAFAIKNEPGYRATLIAHLEDGSIVELPMEYEELRELHGLASVGFDTANKEMDADAAAEFEAEQRAEQEFLRQRETQAELAYDYHYGRER